MSPTRLMFGLFGQKARRGLSSCVLGREVELEAAQQAWPRHHKKSEAAAEIRKKPLEVTADVAATTDDQPKGVLVQGPDARLKPRNTGEAPTATALCHVKADNPEAPPRTATKSSAPSPPKCHHLDSEPKSPKA